MIIYITFPLFSRPSSMINTCKNIQRTWRKSRNSRTWSRGRWDWKNPACSQDHISSYSTEWHSSKPQITVLKGYWSHIWLLSVLRNIKGADYVSPLIISLFIFNISGWTCWIAVVFFKWTSSFLQRDHLCFECIYKYSSIIICVSGGIKWGFSLAGKSLTAHNYILQWCSLLIFLLINQSNGKIFWSLNIISKLVYYVRSQHIIFQIKSNLAVSWILV